MHKIRPKEEITTNKAYDNLVKDIAKGLTTDKKPEEVKNEQIEQDQIEINPEQEKPSEGTESKLRGIKKEIKPKEKEFHEEKKEKIYIQPPVIAHDSEPPSLTFEECHNGRLVASPHDFDFEEEKEIDDIIKEKPKDKKAYNKLVKDIATGLTDNKKPKDIKDEEIKEEKKYIQPPIIAHDSELPRITFEERNSGKLVESLHDFHFEEKEPEKLKIKKEDNLEVEKTDKEEPKQRQFDLRQAKKKEKHRGH